MTGTVVEVLAWHPEAPGWNLPDSDEMGWQGRALCAETDPEAFFPEKGGSTRAAKRVCRGCEVRVECLAYALQNDERFGIWGGLSERERQQIRNPQAAPAAPARPRAATLRPAEPRLCGNKHLKTPDNVYADGSCRQCARDRSRKSLLKKQAARAARAARRRPYAKQELAA